MKIYSKERDYYDAALVYGADPLCYWDRKFVEYKYDGMVQEFSLPTEYFGLKDLALPPNQQSDGKLIHLRHYNGIGVSSIQLGYVFFCGKVYPFVQYYNDYMKKDNFYDLNSFVNFMISSYKESDVERLFNSSEANRYWKRETLLETLTKFFNQKYESDAIHRINDVPVYVLVDGNLTEGGCLKDVQFAKVMDPFTCMQELSMYVSGILGGKSPKMVECSDIDRLESHGFDKRTSFRNCK